MIVKICGMRESANIREVEQLGADWMGFIFYPKSVRYIGEEIEYKPDKMKRVGVFVNDGIERILLLAEKNKLDILQLHGDEPPALCKMLREKGYSVMKAFGITVEKPFPNELTEAYEGCCDYFLFDTKTTLYGGSGKKFDWEMLVNYRGETPFLLSGGIGPDDAMQVTFFSHPKCIGIDLNSGFETGPAVKNVQLLQKFLEQIENIDRQMNRIDRLFEEKKRDIFSVYFTAGYPHLDDTVKVIKALEEEGVDLIEIGVPFSDPMADGPVIQASGAQALHNGMSVKYLFSQLTGIREKVSIPLVMMGYLNPILQFGFDHYCAEAKRCGIDGLIIPDLPFEEYIAQYKPIADKYGLHIIMLITPETSEERIRMIDKHTSGFIYMVSTASVTGARSSFNEESLAYFRRVNKMRLHNPRLIGFGISNKDTFDAACGEASGAIVGSRFVSLLGSEKTIDEAVKELVKAIR